MLNSLPTTPDISTSLLALLQNGEFKEGIEHGHEAFFNEYDGSDEGWSVDELIELVKESTLTTSNSRKVVAQAYLLERWGEGHPMDEKIDWGEVNKHREHLGQNMFYYGLGFLLGFIDQGLRPDECCEEHSH